MMRDSYAMARAVRGAALCGVLLLSLVVLSAADAAACATCVSPFECDMERCEGSDSCSFDGPPVEKEIEGYCNVLVRFFIGCGGKKAVRVPSCRATGGPCRSPMPECDPRHDLDPDFVDPWSPIGDDREASDGSGG